MTRERKPNYRPQSEPERFLTHSNELTAKAVIWGIDSVERAQEWLEYEVNNQKRKEIIGMLNQRKMELKNDD